jgi:hypothetical protein
MAVQFVGITQVEIEQFLNRAYRALRPRRDSERGELFYDLNLSKAVVIRIWSSIPARSSSGEGAGIGEDAIRIQLFSKVSKRPLKKGKSPIVKRTQNWRDNLKARIGDATEEYEDKESYWEARATLSSPSARAPEPPPVPEEVDTEEGQEGLRVRTVEPPPTDAQMNFVGRLMKMFQARRTDWREVVGYLKAGQRSGLVYANLDSPPTYDEVVAGGKMACSSLIDALKRAVGLSYSASGPDPLDLHDQVTGD